MWIYDTAIYFFFYGILGWCTEVAFAAVMERRFVNRGFLNGPICPIYGVGVAAVVSLLKPLENQLLLLYLASALLVTLLEGLTGYVMDRLFHHKWWDYSGMPFNIGGYVCPLFSLLWGTACVLIVKVVHPMVQELCGRLPLAAGVLLLSVCSVGLAADVIVTVNDIMRWNRQLDAMEKIAAELRELSGKMGENIYENVMDTIELREKLDVAVGEQKTRIAQLKEKYSELAQRSIRSGRRFMRAFPKLQSRRHKELLEQIRCRLRNEKK